MNKRSFGGTRRSPDSIPLGLAGAYKAVTEVPFRGVAVEALAWTLPGLLFPRRAGHPRGRLLFFAALNAGTLYVAKRAIAQNPDVLRDRKWVYRQTALAWLRYVGYAAVVPRRTYWRGELDNIAFFSQTWWPIAVWGAARGPLWSAVAGPLHGYAFYLSSAWANGEPLIPSREVREKIVNYANTSLRAGLVCLIIFRILDRAAAQAEAERAAVSQQVAAEEEERSIRRQAMLVREDLSMSLLRVRKLGQELLPAELARRVATPIDDALNRPWSQGEATTGSAFKVVESVAGEFPLNVEVTGDDALLDLRSLGAFEAMVYTALDNCNVHAFCSSVEVEVKLEEDELSVRVKDDGVGLLGKNVEFPITTP